MATILSTKQKEMLLSSDVRRLLKIMNGEARVVGGAVRDVLLGRVPVDMDLASSLKPTEVTEILEGEGIKVVPTGFAHGTVTAILNHKGYEITTLRRDTLTDGRHAHVVFTKDWQVDAERRDFTMNALSVDAAGVIYDYVGGLADIKARRVRFIGDATERIREDVLRVLRYFRFQAWFGNETPDAVALEACRVHARLIPTLSAERIAREIGKLVLAKDPEPALRLMQQTGVLTFVLPDFVGFACLRVLRACEEARGLPPSRLARLASLLPPVKKVARATAERLKFPKADRTRLEVLAELPALIKRSHAPQNLRRCLYGYGAAACRDAAAMVGADADVFALIAGWVSPEFPLRGKDLLGAGFEKGARLGALLRNVEAWWIEDDFKADREACLARAKELAALDEV